MLGGFIPTSVVTPRLAMFDSVLHNLRIVIIDKMAKPEEVIIVEDENGEIVREMTKDTEVIAQYKTMKDTIVYLTNLNWEGTEQIMLEKLYEQVDGKKFSWNGLNTLCWAIGSISGAMTENDEKRFLVTVIKDLLRLCEEQRGKDNKAVVASNIMVRCIFLSIYNFYNKLYIYSILLVNIHVFSKPIGSFSKLWSINFLNSCMNYTLGFRTWPAILFSKFLKNVNENS